MNDVTEHVCLAFLDGTLLWVGPWGYNNSYVQLRVLQPSEVPLHLSLNRKEAEWIVERLRPPIPTS